MTSFHALVNFNWSKLETKYQTKDDYFVGTIDTIFILSILNELWIKFVWFQDYSSNAMSREFAFTSSICCRV